MAWYNPSDPKQRNLMLGGIGLLVAIVPFQMYVLAPIDLLLAENQAHFDTVDGANVRARVQAARGGGEFEERNRIYERHVQKLEELIPSAEETGLLMVSISDEAARHGVRIDRMDPEPSGKGS